MVKRNSIYILITIILLIGSGIYFIRFFKKPYTINNSFNKIELSKDLVEKKFNSGLELLNQGKYEESIKYWNDVVKNNSDNSKIDNYRLILANSLLGYGNSFYKEKIYAKKSLNILNQIKNCKDNNLCSFLKGYAYEITKDYNIALNYYDGSLNSKIKIITKEIILNQMGHVYDIKGKNEKAFEFYKKAYNINDKNPIVSTNVGRSLIKRFKLEEAISYLNNALDNTDNKFLKSEIYYDLSSIYLYLSGDYTTNWQLSINYAQKAIDLSPDYPLGYVGVSRILILTGKKLEEAEKLLRIAINKYYNLSLSYEWLGLLEQNKGHYKKSIEYFEESKKKLEKDIILMKDVIGPNKGKLDYFISLSYMMDKNPQKSLEYLKNSLKNPHYFVIMMLEEEFQKEEYGIFKTLQGNNEFLEIVDKINNKYIIK